MISKLLAALLLLAMLSGCSIPGRSVSRPYYDTPRYRFGIINSGDAALQQHMDAEREHLRQEEEELARRRWYGH